jgi:low temperature requirement protein LtrA
MFQRVFILWVLLLSVFYGNNLAYLTEDTQRAKVISISLFLFIRSSLVLIEAFYSIFIPWLRKLVLLAFLLYLPSIGLWIAGIYIKGDRAAGPIFAAIILDYMIPVILDSPLVGNVTSSEYGKALDPHHFTSRMASFFVIILGEGVLQLIKDGPLGIGITRTAGFGVWSLSIYFLLVYIYFNKDSSHAFIPAVVKKGWRTIIWIS